ncbi:HET domain-containing protein, partial [Candidatus Bathyarchaeota archaeon]|nr:HET domain-containing protein [Candidatus Bathyarchaeota archaeon]
MAAPQSRSPEKESTASRNGGMPKAQNTPFRHLSLPPIAETGPTAPYTRILHLAPGTADKEPLKGHIEIVNAKNAPAYEALSYTWGEEEALDDLWIGGVLLPIKPNLAAALRSLRFPTQARKLWIDAVCIDQASDDERTRQVRYVRNVYKHAARVIVWLGERTTGVDVAFKAAERIARARDLTRPAAADGVSDPAPAKLTPSTLGDLPADAMSHLSELFSRPYFTRSWSVQEVYASSSAVARCDDLEMPLSDLLSSIIVVFSWRDHFEVKTSLGLWCRVALQREADPAVTPSKVEGSLGSFLSLLGLTRNMSASDPRDKIFSLLGICNEGLEPVLTTTLVNAPANGSRLIQSIRRGHVNFYDWCNYMGPNINCGRPRGVRADYTRDTVLAYCDLARMLLGEHPRLLETLNHVQHRGDPEEGPFPSWVPRWFQPTTTSVFPGEFMAGLCKRPRYQA